ncbi:MAG: tRNA (adenosine(37)-N6)-threonylcarbamoyltransferase complex dimerization subunit type 1 TsaB [Dehalococcoidia bacterium]
MADQPPLDALDLAIDSAALDASLALTRGDEVIATHTWHVETSMSRELLGAIDALLAEARVARADLASISVAAGPGQYGPLRIGVATAQGLALALEIPLAGVARLEADAAPHLASGNTVVAVHDAGRSGIAWAAYTLGGPGEAPRVLVEARLDPTDAVARTAPRPAVWCGEITDDLRSARDAEARSGDTEASASPGGRAAAMSRLARLHGAYGDAALVDAVYLRPPPITRPRSPAD